MSRKESLEVVIAFFKAKLETTPDNEKARVYEALSNILPSQRARAHAKQTAWVLREAEKLQTQFLPQLFSELKAKNHDGHKDGQGDGV